MKIYFLKLKKGYKKESFIINPNIYWRFVLSVSLVVVLVSFGYGFKLFADIVKSSDIENKPEVNKEITRKEQIEKILEYFNEREKKSEAIIKSPPVVIDPSL